MPKELEEKIITTLLFFGLKKDCLFFDKDFNVYLISILKDNFFDTDFCTSLETVLHSIVGKDVFLKVDFGGSFSKSLALIKDEVHSAVNQAKYYNQPIVLQSKNAFERRLKHLYISNNYAVRHESFGEGLNRRIIVYPD